MKEVEHHRSQPLRPAAIIRAHQRNHKHWGVANKKEGSAPGGRGGAPTVGRRRQAENVDRRKTSTALGWLGGSFEAALRFDTDSGGWVQSSEVRGSQLAWWEFERRVIAEHLFATLANLQTNYEGIAKSK